MFGSSHDDPTAHRHWLCIAYAFPPINRSGTHRTLAFVKHLHRLGWDATVLTVKPRGESLDDDLLHQVPGSTSVIRTEWVDLIERVKTFPSTAGRAASRPKPAARGIREWVSHLLVTPDSRLGWVPAGVRAGLTAIRRNRPDVIFSTSPYMSAHLIGLIISRWTGLPWVADFRDPWGDNPFRVPVFASLARWDSLLERAVLRAAAHVVCCTPTMTEALCQRRPVVMGKCSTIMNGIDLELMLGVARVRIAPADDFVLMHCGQFYGPRSPSPWFAALGRIRRSFPETAARMRFALLGSDSCDGRPLVELAAEAGVADMVRVLGAKCHRESLSYMAGADALLLAGAAGDGAALQIPNKLFEYLAVRKPIVAALSPHSPARRILDEAQADTIVCEPGDEAAIADALVRLATRRLSDAAGSWSGLARYDRALRAAELAHVFERIIWDRAARLGTAGGIRLSSRLYGGKESFRGAAQAPGLTEA